MKKIFYFFLLLSSFGKAQDFASVGATWTYNDHELIGNLNYPRTIFSIADTVVNGIPCHIVIGDCQCGTSATNYLYEINRRVYVYNNATSDFRLIYNFNLNEGDSWTVLAQNTVGDSITLRVDSVTFDTINGNIRKVQHISPSGVFGNVYVFPGPIIEGIGSKSCLYPQAGFCDPPTDGLRCYQDSLIGFYSTHLAPTCDVIYADSGIGIRELENKIHVTLSPNPMHEACMLQIDDNGSALGVFRMTDLSGRVVREERMNGNKLVVHRNELEEGLYFYQILFEKQTAAGKIMID